MLIQLLKSTFVITTIIGISIDLVKTPSGSGKTICSSSLFAGTIPDTKETEFGIRPLTIPLLIVADEDDAIIMDESFGST